MVELWLCYFPVCLRPSYSIADNNANREEAKKNNSKEVKGQPPSGGTTKKRLKSKKTVTQKAQSSESVDTMAMALQQQQLQYVNGHHQLHTQHSQIVNSQNMKGLGLLGSSNNGMLAFPNLKADNNHSQPNNNNRWSQKQQPKITFWVLA